MGASGQEGTTMLRQPPTGSRFDYDGDAEAIIVGEGDMLVWSEFGEGVWEKLRRPFIAVGGDWRVWTIRDRVHGDAIVVKAEMLAWPVALGDDHA